MNILKRKDHPPMNEPVVQMRKPVGQAAAEFAQTINDMLAEKQRIQVELESTRAQLLDAEAHNKALTKHVDDIMARLDYFHRRTVEVETKLEMVGKTILEVLNYRADPPAEPAPAVEPVVPLQNPEYIKAVEDELAQDK